MPFLGTHIRGYQHLTRSVGISQPIKLLVVTNSRRIAIIECIKTSDSNDIHMFNNVGWGRGIYPIATQSMSHDTQEMLSNLQCRNHSCYRITNENDYFSLGFLEVVKLPDDFYKIYESVRTSNKKLFSSIFGKLTSEMDGIPQYLFIYGHDVPNLFAWALTNYYRYGVSLHLIKHILVWQMSYPQLIKNLSKGTITAYNGRDNVAILYNEMIALRRCKRANDIFNTFNTTQKRLLKSIELTDEVLNTCSGFNRLSPVKKHNFIRKMSTVESVEEILRQMKILSKTHFEWSKASLMEYISNSQDSELDCEIVFEKDNLLIVKVNNYETIKYLAKTTNWCISKNKRYWDDYIQHRNEGAVQYIVFDFNKKEDDELSIVGFTTAANVGITDAHSFTNVSMMANTEIMYSNLSTFMPETFTIHTFLKSHNIPTSTFFEQEKSLFNWNKEDCIAFLEFALGEDNFDILADINNKLCVQASGENVRFVVCPNKSLSDGKFIIFFDFNKSDTDENRLMYSAIHHDNFKQEEYCGDVCNAQGYTAPMSFDSLLQDYELPFDTIARVYNIQHIFKSALVSNDLHVIGSLLKDKSTRNEILSNNQRAANALHDAITKSFWTLHSFDYLNLIYDECNLKLTDLLPTNIVDRLLSYLFYDISNNMRGRVPRHIPTIEDIRKLHNGEINDVDTAKFIGLYSIMSRIVSTETWTSIIGYDCINALAEMGRHGDLSIDITSKIYHLMSFNNLNDKNKIYLQLVGRHNNTDVLNKLSKKELPSDIIEYLVSQLSASSQFMPIFSEKLSKYTEIVPSTVIPF